MHGDGFYAGRDAKRLRRGDDIGCIDVAKSVITETNAKVIGQPVGAIQSLHRRRVCFFGRHPLGWIFKSSTAIAVKHL
ncbi:hypothetical protein D3C74_326780 [compost metagenome]